MASLRDMSVMLALAILFAACFTAEGQGYYNNFGGGGSSAYASASASASASSNSFGSPYYGGYGSPYYGGYGGGGYGNNGYGGGGYRGGRRNCFLGLCTGYFGKRLLSVPSFQDIMSSMGISKANSNINVVPSHTMIETQLDNIMEYPDRVYIDIIVPGLLPRDDVSANIQDGTLLVTGKTHKSTDDCKVITGESSCKSKPSSSFAHSMSVPDNIDVARITTKVANGVVRIKLPKE